MGLFKKLSEKLFKPKKMMRDARKVIGLKSRIDADLFDEIEEILMQADVGYETTEKIMQRMKSDPRTHKEGSADIILELLYDAMSDILEKNERKLDVNGHRPYVILVVGVNGAGKTTTIGKIAQTLGEQGKKCMFVAADTFRAAAINQLRIWADRTNSLFSTKDEGSDPASVCYEALSSPEAQQCDVIMIDTAGRLHTRKELMEELRKIDRVIKKVMPDAPHETILVLDATTGQNAVEQAKIFRDVVGVTGIVMTKLDGTAKGGILCAIRDLFEIPVLKIGVGESAEDLQDFDPQEYVDALFAE